jgi:hypothetical protein
MAAAGIRAGRAGRARRLTASGPRRAAAALSAALMLAALTGAGASGLDTTSHPRDYVPAGGLGRPG